MRRSYYSLLHRLLNHQAILTKIANRKKDDRRKEVQSNKNEGNRKSLQRKIHKLKSKEASK